MKEIGRYIPIVSSCSGCVDNCAGNDRECGCRVRRGKYCDAEVGRLEVFGAESGGVNGCSVSSALECRDSDLGYQLLTYAESNIPTSVFAVLHPVMC